MDVVALLAHPDDELMCAGTLARFVDEGHTVRLVTVFVDERADELTDSTAAIGCKLDMVQTLGEDAFVWARWSVTYLEPLVPPCDLLISHRVNDHNTSHAHLGNVARTLCRKNRTSLWEIDQTIPGGLTDHPAPNHFVDISKQIWRKEHAVDAYTSQLERYPGLAGVLDHRDAMNGWSIGVEAAEGFTIVKSVQ